MEHLQVNMKAIHQELELQKEGLKNLFATVNETIVTVNLHSKLLSHSIDLHQNHEIFKRELILIQEPILFDTIFFINEIQNGMNDLTQGHIPLYFVSNEVIKKLLMRANGDELEDFQVNLAFEMGRAIPLYIDPEALEVCFLLAIPLISFKNVFQIKTVHNVGTWNGDIHLKIKTPEIVAYQPWVPGLYAIPILHGCERFKDNNFQCNGNPFSYDATQALCGLEYIKHGSEKCEVTMRKVDQSGEVRTAIVKDEWLISTTAKNMSVYYERLIMNRVVALPSIVSLIKVPPQTRVTIGKTTLYPLGTEIWEGEVESIDVFQEQSLPVNTDLKFLLEHKPNHTIQMTVKKNNISIEQLDYSMQDYLILENQHKLIPTELMLYICGPIVMIWLIMLTYLLIRVTQIPHQPIPISLEMIETRH